MTATRKLETPYVIAALVLLLLLGLTSLPPWVMAADNPSVSLDAAQAGPRQVEDTTVQAISRDYASAWKSLAQAVDENNADVLNANFVGVARERFGNLIADQKKNGLRQRIVDRGHKVRVTFYSPDGSSLQIHDTAQIEVQYLDGNKVVSSEPMTANYIGLLTPGENSWKVRVMENVASF